MTDAIQIERERGPLTLRLNRPDKKSALTRAFYSQLAEAVRVSKQLMKAPDREQQQRRGQKARKADDSGMNTAH